jgi:hypothetical protein
MDIVPERLQKIIAEHEEALAAYFGEQVFTNLVKRNGKHLLVMLAKHLDLTEIENECRSYHHESGPGRPAEHKVGQMVRALLVGWVHGHSLRALEEQLNTNLLVRWYVGYGLFESTPDHATLGRFEYWVLTRNQRVYFDSVLRQIYTLYPEQRQQVQMGDTYAMQANAARQGPVPLWRQLSKRVLEAAIHELADVGSIVSGLSWVNLFGPPQEKHPARMSAAEKQERFKQVALAAQDLLERFQKALVGCAVTQGVALRQALVYLQKTLQDEARIDAEMVTPRRPKGSFCLGSATDPQATFRNHGERDGEEDLTLGYNPQVAATTDGLITETQAHPGALPDQATIVELIREQKMHQGYCPPKLIYDAAGGFGKVRQAVEQVSAGQTIVSAPLPDYAQRNARFGPYDFSLSPDGRTLTCPHGQSTQVAFPATHGDGRKFRFVPRLCWQGEPPGRMQTADLSLRCPLWEQCRDPKQGPRSLRQVFISDYRSQVEAAQAYNRTPAYLLDHKLRQRVERVIAELVRYNGARRCRRIGLIAADWQAKMSATAYNLKWWMRRLGRIQALSPPSPRTDLPVDPKNGQN